MKTVFLPAADLAVGWPRKLEKAQGGVEATQGREIGWKRSKTLLTAQNGPLQGLGGGREAKMDPTVSNGTPI